MAVRDIYVVDASKFDTVMWIDAALTIGEIEIAGVDDMVRKIETRCAGGDRIGELRIVGHGNDTGQYVGADWLSASTVRRHRPALNRLQPLFSSEGVVVLGGCLVGHASELMILLADILNVPIRAFRASQRPLIPGDEGSRVQCYITCTREGRRGFDYLDW